MRTASASGRSLSSSTLGQHVGIEQDRGQQVVEVVRDPAGELAERFHALRLRELQLGVLLLGDVGHHGADAADLAALVDTPETS